MQPTHRLHRFDPTSHLISAAKDADGSMESVCEPRRAGGFGP